MTNKKSHLQMLACVALLAALTAPAVAEGKSTLQTRDDYSFLWISSSGQRIIVNAPKFSTDSATPIKLAAQSRTAKPGSVVFEYGLDIETIGGTCRIEASVDKEPDKDLLLYNVELNFNKTVRSNFSVEYVFDVEGKLAKSITLPEIKGFIKSAQIGKDTAGQGHFVMGKDSASGGEKLALPAVDIKFDKSLAIATDPFFGAGFHPEYVKDKGKECTRVTVSSRYSASKVPVKNEKRTIALQFHRKGIDGMFANFYNTTPQIKPGADWIHDIHLNYYDYLSQDGAGWYSNLKKLAEVIPPQYRGNVLVALHGWYDYLARYCYNIETGKMDDQWNAFNLTDRQHEMSKAEMHKRIKFAKDLGFRVALYFADGTSSDSGLPEYRKQWQAQDEQGNPIKCWMGPGVIAQTYAMDPSNPEVQQWFCDYMNAILDEFASEIDALNWDETFQFNAGHLTKTDDGYAYPGRGMMTLTAKLTKLVQSRHDINPDLVFLTSDDLGGPAPDAHTALVSHGTYQDSHCDPTSWPGGMLVNYRNCLISCNWRPITKAHRNRIAADKYALPQGLSDGYGNYTGPANMDEKILADTIARFIRNVKTKRQRTRYLVEQP